MRRFELEIKSQISDNMGSPPAGNRRKAKPTSVLDDEKKIAGNLSLPQNAAASILQIILQRRTNYSASSFCSAAGNGDLSTVGILKLAKEKLLQGKNLYVASIFVDGLFDTKSRLLSLPESEDLELALLFQAAALKISHKQFDRAKMLLNLCQASASPSGNALHRTVSCFSLALQERIAKELGGNAGTVEERTKLSKIAAMYKLKNLRPEAMKCYQVLPTCQGTDLTAVQTIVDNVASAKRVHLIDLGFKNGSQWPSLMQALAARNDCTLELLKITAIGTPEDIENGKMLSSFAECMNIPFEFKLIVAELKDVTSDLFELSDDQMLAVNLEMCLSSLLATPDHLVSLLGTIEKLNPCVMDVIEMEASMDSPVFLDRFDAALSVYAAVFDCLEDCMERDNPYRAALEGGFISEAIRDIVTCEGEERVCRGERLDFWRAFLSRLGFVEVALSDVAFCQLKMFLKGNPHWGSRTVEVNGKGISVGWKGTPIKSLHMEIPA